MRVNGVGGQANQLYTALGEFRLELGKGAQLGGADGGVVLWVREEDCPLVADPLVKVNGAVCSLGLEVGGNASETEGRGAVGGRHGW